MPTIELDEDLCKCCYICLEFCPREVFVKGKEPSSDGLLRAVVAHPEKCLGMKCLRCELLCPDLAITVRDGGSLSLADKPPQTSSQGGLRPRQTGASLAEPSFPAGKHFMSGDEACAEGAIAAGCRFYAGYPITPASEVMTSMMRRLKEVGGVFMQMEDEIASIASCIGASWGGVKSMTATSGPGFSLMMENLGYAVMTETPTVIVDVQRAGPSTGQATRPASGDMMQAKWGTHGGVEVIALAPSSVQEMYDFTVRAFNLSERFRTPVIVLADEIVGHLYENFQTPKQLEIYNRESASKSPPFGGEEPDTVPSMPFLGDGQQLLITGSTHDEFGWRETMDPSVQERLVRRLASKILTHGEEIIDLEMHLVDDAQKLLIAYGAVARSAAWAVRKAREKHQRVGMLRLKTVWPFPDALIAKLAGAVEEIIVPEMNLGQIAREVERASKKQTTSLTQIDGEPVDPRRILRYLEQEVW